MEEQEGYPEDGSGEAEGQEEAPMTPEEEQAYMAMLMQMMKPQRKGEGSWSEFIKGNILWVSLLLAVVLVLLVLMG